MIKINLLPLTEKKKKQQMLLVFYAACLLFVVLTFMLWFWFTKRQELVQIETKIAAVEEESKGYQEKINEIKALEAKEANLASLKKIVLSIQNDQKKILSLVDQLAFSLPQDIWLTEISQGAGNAADSFVIKGNSFNAENIKSYVNSLKRPGSIFSDVNMDITGFSSSNGTKVSVFEIKAKLASGQ